MTRTAILAALAVAACSTPAGVPRARFANAPPVTAVDDRRDVPSKPAKREYNISLYRLDSYVYRYVTRALEVQAPQRAGGVNALDEVPDSTWFTNRIGIRELTPDEVRIGPVRVGSPEPHKPWTIHSTKVGGASVGFLISDARGKRFLLKFDLRGEDETESTAEVVVGKLLWACGFNVAENHVVYLQPGDLRIAPDAEIKDWSGSRGKLTQAFLDERLALVAIEPDGRMRAMASLMLDGKPLGGHAAEGTREDDPNDRIPHERRRDLRGAYAIYAWLDHHDLKEDNTLDMWVADPAYPARHYVKHYLVDFGRALGIGARIARNLRQSHAYRLDLPELARSFVTAGLRPRPWERRSPPALRGLGLFDSATYRPGAWRAASPGYIPVRVADDVDKFWGAKIVMRFTREQLRAAVDAGRLTDPRAAEHLVNTLVARQRATARHFFERVNPLDRFAVRGRDLCFDDLLLTHRLSPVAEYTRYALASHDHAGRPIGEPTTVRAATGGRICVPVALAPAGDGYTIIAIRTTRLDADRITFVHVARDPTTREPRVIGIWRR